MPTLFIIAIFIGMHGPVNNDTKAQTMAIPALSPSFFCTLVERYKCTSSLYPPFISRSLSMP